MAPRGPTLPIPSLQKMHSQQLQLVKKSDDVLMTQDAKRSADAVHTSNSSPFQMIALFARQPANSSTELEGCPFCDVGGSGHCAYRALAVAYTCLSKRDVKEAINASKSLGATLRAGVSSHLKKHKHFESSFAVDPRWTETLEGGPIPITMITIHKLVYLRYKVGPYQLSKEV